MMEKRTIVKNPLLPPRRTANGKRRSVRVPIEVFFSVLLYFLMAATPVYAVSSVNLSLDRDIYGDLQIWAAEGLLTSDLQSIRPFAASEIGHQLADASARCRALSVPSASCRRILGDYAILFNAEITESKSPDQPSFTYLKPLDVLSLQYRYMTTPFSVYNREGLDDGEGHNAVIHFQSHARLGKYLSFFVQPALIYNQHFGPNGADGQRMTFRLHKGYAKLTVSNLELLAGRDALWWGPGYHGSLLMSNNAHPFDMLKLSNPEPVLLPWIFSYLGPVQFNLIFSQLNDIRRGQELANPFLYGLRLALKPHPSVEIGASHLVLFGGPGRRDMTLGELLSTLYSNLNQDNQKTDSNQEFAMDMAITLPSLKKYLYVIDGLRLYAEIGGEDIGQPPDRRAYLAGLALFKPFSLDQAVFRVEYAILSPYSVPNAWYSHTWYPMRYEGRVFGHHAGTDAEDIFIQWSHRMERISYKIGFDRERSGIQTRPAPQFKNQYFAEAGWHIDKNTTIVFRYTYEDVTNANHIRNERLQNHYIGFETSLSF